jgi:hypothetical protein
MNEIKHTPGPWNAESRFGRDGRLIFEILSSNVSVCEVDFPRVGPYHVAHRYEVRERNANLIAAAPDMADILEIIAADADAGTIMLTSGIRLAIDAALIKAGRKKAPEPVRHFTINGGGL